MTLQERLFQLRSFMKEKGLSAYYIPKNDRYFGEYNQSHDECLAYISGFTGSYGYCIVTKEKAFLFVDGRYTLQAKNEVDLSLWTVDSLIETPLSSFLKDLKPDSFGFNEWILSVDQYDKLKNAGVNLISLKEDPFDKIWLNRPPLSYGKIFEYSITYAGESAESKIKTIQSKIEKPYLVTQPDQICWLLNIRGEDIPYSPLPQAMALIPIKGPVKLFINDLAELDHLKDTTLILPFSQLEEELKKHKKICCVASSTPHALTTFSTLIPSADIIAPLKAIKNDVEILNMKKVHEEDAKAVIKTIQWIKKHPEKEKLTELDVADHLLQNRINLNNFYYPSFPTIAASGPNGAIVHYRPTSASNRSLADRILLLDSGGQYLGGTTDVTRTIALSTPTKEEKTAYTLVLKGHIALSKIHFPKGTTGGMLDSIARQFLWEQGLDYLHGTGHGVGCFLNVHEGPQSIRKNASVALLPGMILSNEPGFYKENDFGIRIENLMVVVNSSHEGFYTFDPLTLIPYDDDLIDETMLTIDEKNWIDSYNKKIARNDNQ